MKEPPMDAPLFDVAIYIAGRLFYFVMLTGALLNCLIAFHADGEPDWKRYAAAAIFALLAIAVRPS